MYLDKQNIKESFGWIVLSGVLLLVCTIWYAFFYAPAMLNGPSGGRWQGIVLGSLGTGIMVFAFLLTLRKKYRERRWGKTYTWVQGHIWLGLITFPLIIFHAGGFKLGGDVSAVLMILFYVCYISGVVGMLLQHFLPRWMLDNVNYETIYDEIDHVARENLKIARRLIKEKAPVSIGPVYDAELKLVPLSEEAAQRDLAHRELRNFYEMKVRPYLAGNLLPRPDWKWIVKRFGWGVVFKRSKKIVPMPGDSAFGDLRQKLFKDQYDTLDVLKRLVDQRKQFHQQKRLHAMMHGWLLVHVPASWAMMLLIPVHAVMSLRYV